MGLPFVLHWQNGLLKRKTTYVPIDGRNLKNKALVRVMNIGLKVEIFA